MVFASSARIAKHAGLIHAAIVVVVALVLLLGTMTLCALRWYRGQRTGTSVIWLPLSCLFAGPILSLAYWALDLFCLSRKYYSHYPMERYDLLLPALELGILIGVVVATAFTTGLLVSAGLTVAAAASKDFDKRVLAWLAVFWAMVLVPLLWALVVLLSSRGSTM